MTGRIEKTVFIFTFFVTSCSPGGIIPAITPIVHTQTSPPPTETLSPTPTLTQVPIGITEIASLGKGWASFVEWSPDRNSYAIGGSLGVHIYDAKSHNEIKYIPRELVSDVEFTPDGQLIGITSFGDLTIMRLSDEKVLFEKEESFPVQIIFSPNASSFAYIWGCLSNPCSYAIIIGDYTTKKDLFRFEIGNISEVIRLNQIAFNTDGTLLAAACSTGSIHIWETSTGELKTILEEHRDSVNGVEFSPTNKPLLASYSEDGTVKLWDVEVGKTIKTLSSFQGDIERISYSSDGSSLEIFTDTMVQTFDTAIERIVSSKKYTDTDALLLQGLRSSGGYIGSVDGLAYSPDGQTLAVSSYADSPVLLWDIPTKQIKATIETTATQLVYSHHGKLLASVDENGEIAIWDTGNYSRLHTLKTKNVDSTVFPPDDSKIAVSSEGKIRIWDVQQGKSVQTINTGADKTILLSYSLDGDVISAVDANDFSVNTWNTSTGELIHTFTLPSNPDYREAINLSNNILAVFKVTDIQNNIIELWDLNTGEQLQTFKGIDDYMYPSLAYSPDRSVVAISTYYGITFYCSNTGSPLYSHDEIVHWINFSFSPHGHYLAIGNNFGKLVIWDVSRILRAPSCINP